MKKEASERTEVLPVLGWQDRGTSTFYGLTPDLRYSYIVEYCLLSRGLVHPDMYVGISTTTPRTTGVPT